MPEYSQKLRPRLLALAGICFLAACSGPTVPAGSAYVPSFTRVPEGYRPALSTYYPVVSYVACQSLAPDRIREIQQDFYRPLVKGDYQNLIGAIVINGSGTESGTTFTIWLLDGRKLDSGNILTAVSPIKDIGTRFYNKALSMLQEAIPRQKLEAAKRVSQTS
jgi:hypothetical protein